MKRIELIGIQKGLRLLNGISDYQLGKYRAKISRIVDQEVEEMESFRSSEEWDSLDKLILEFNIKHSKKGDSGRPITSNGQFVFENIDDRNAAFEEFKTINKIRFDDRNKQLEAFKEDLKKEYTPPFDLIPSSLIYSVEKYYKEELKQPSPFKSEVIMLIWPIIDENK